MAKAPGTNRWASYRIVACADREHAWRQWEDEPPEKWTPEKDWDLRAVYRYAPRSKIRADLLATIREIGVRPVHKNDQFNEIVQWTMNELPALAPDHPLTPKAVALATFWWRYR